MRMTSIGEQDVFTFNGYVFEFLHKSILQNTDWHPLTYTYTKPRKQTCPTLGRATAVSHPCLDSVSPLLQPQSYCDKAAIGSRRKEAKKTKSNLTARL